MDVAIIKIHKLCIIPVAVYIAIAQCIATGYMLNKNRLAVKKCEANQKQHCSYIIISNQNL